MYAPRPAATTASAIVDFSPRMILSAPPPPRIDASAENRSRNDQQRQPGDVRLLRLRHRDAAIFRILRPDRNQVFLLRQPAENVHKQVFVAGQPQSGIGREV